MGYFTLIKRLPDIKKKRLYIMYKDNDPLNTAVGNLYIITLSEQLKKLMAPG